MRYAGFCGPSNPTQSLIADCERLINLYPEQVESRSAPTGAALLPVPGQQPRITTTDVGTRAIVEVAGRAFAVVGGGFWELFSDWSATRRGAVAQDNYPATISYNSTTGGQLFITSGGNGYCYDLATNTLTTVLTGDATMGGFLSARFLAFNIATGRVRMSGQNDGLTWDPTLWFGRSQAPDPWQSMLVRPPEIWLIGEQTGECWYDSGSYPQPFAPIPGAFFPWGTAAPFSAAIAGQSVTWVARNIGGGGTVVAATGYTPQPISNYAVSTALSRASTLSDAEILVYGQAGHLFACCNFGQAGQTWVYDFSIGVWHERLSWNTAEAKWEAWRPRVHGYAFGTHLVGDRSSGILSELTDAYCLEADGSPIRRVRVAPPLWAPSAGRITVDRLEVFVEAGLGTGSGQGEDPKLMLRTSGDAKRWSSERTARAGAQGDFGRRAIWTRCGSSDKLWVPELSMTDPIPWRISGASIEGTGFQSTAGGV